MSLHPDYFQYLNHFGKTVTVREFFEKKQVPDLTALRHDVDYDLDIALEMSYWEKEQNIQSTFFLLHSAAYWTDPEFMEKCLQIQDFGHEVGLHLNILAEWMRGNVDDVSLTLENLITRMREAGLNVSGVSAHGDPLCYEQHFINYWCLSELRPPEPASSESGISAEGILVDDENFQIHYPESHRLNRPDGQILPLWSISMNKLEIKYEANHIPYDSYFTDSGGGWYRSEDPMKQSFSSGRHQILMHPVYWRGPQKIYFFLSTARTGSKWIAEFLEHATPLKAQHEFILNHRFYNDKLVPEKHTGAGFKELTEKKGFVKELIREARAWIDELSEDYAEANVYLERFFSILEEVFPDAVYVHIYRDPRNVIRSLINREWYDTPEDSRHPVMKVKGWNRLSQFEKACWYVRKTNETLLLSCQHRIAFEKMVTDIDYLMEQFRILNIPVFPRMAKHIFNKRINTNWSYDFPDFIQWPSEHKSTFHAICDPLNKALGYETEKNMQVHSVPQSYPKRKMFFKKWKFRRTKSNEVILEKDFCKNRFDISAARGCEAKKTVHGIEIIPEPETHSHFLFGGGTWHQLKREGWKPEFGCYYRGILDIKINHDGSIQLFCLMHNKEGNLIAKRSLGQVKESLIPFPFSFKVRSDAERFNIALYISSSKNPGKITLKTFQLEKVFLKYS